MLKTLEATPVETEAPLVLTRESSASEIEQSESRRIRSTNYGSGKRWVTRVVAVALFILALPLMTILCLVIRLTSRGPAIYRQKRVGKDGRVFTMYKLRSMRIDAEAGTGPIWAAVTNDPRSTWLGNYLRDWHLDELPQLWNVIRGEMALVGPRPERPEIVQTLVHALPNYLDRLVVLPGMTGLAQVNLPPDTDMNSVRRKLVLDRHYARSSSLELDFRLMLATLLGRPLPVGGKLELPSAQRMPHVVESTSS
jgi:lipopolysaccharide/colanic/teichoic acid biosynthesis glycosyltransferase